MSFKILASALSLVVLMTSCKKDDNLGNVENIPGLGGDVYVKGPIDQWIYDSLTVPYNIDVKYKWNQFELSQEDKNVTPVKESVVIPLFTAVKNVWIDPYVAEAGPVFFKKYVPKFFILAGSAAYGYDGTALLGQAGGGRQIFLLQLNYFRNKTMPGFTLSDTAVQKEAFHTIHHEFAHIFDQNKQRPYDFDRITQGDYSSDWINISDQQAREKGIITAYASSKAAEDFAEMVSIMLIEGKDGFQRLIDDIVYRDENGDPYTDSFGDPYPIVEAQNAIIQKRDVIINYFKKSWDIDFESLQNRTRQAIEQEFF